MDECRNGSWIYEIKVKTIQYDTNKNIIIVASIP